MVGGITLEKAIEIIGHDRGTCTKEVARALRKVGARVPRNRLVRFSCGPLPRRCVMKVWFEDTKERWSHWILHWDGFDYDPSNSGRACWINRNPRLTSYLEISPRRWA
jgi:hypothetical protein